MGKQRFVKAETVRLDLSDGDWIEVKSCLTYGEWQRLATARSGHVLAQQWTGKDAEASIDLEAFNLTRLSLWLMDWSFTDERGKSVAVSRSAIAALDYETIDEIDAALGVYLKEQEARKNLTMPGASKPGTS